MQRQQYYYSGTTSPKKQNPTRAFITVEVTMPHVGKYGHEETMQLTYGCNFANELRTGDRVLVPPSAKAKKWLIGKVVSLESTGYEGPVRYVAKLGRRVR